jgi:hypothetical protein
MQGPVAINLISWNVIFIWETDYWTRTMKRFPLFHLLKSLYSDTVWHLLHNSSNLELLIDKTSSIYLYVKLKALVSWIFLFLTSFEETRTHMSIKINRLEDLNMVFTSRNWFVMQGPVAIDLISWNVIFIWETDYWTRTMKRFALFHLLKSLYSDTKILS